MPDPYQVLGPSVPSMLGRAALMGRIDNHLRKPSPDHVSVVGPAHYGKSVLLCHAAATYRDGVEQYVTATYVDLRRGVPPASDREFLRRFAEEIKAALQATRPEIAVYFEFEDIPEYDVLDFVFDQLERDGVRFLAVLDGFDYALAGTGLTPNLWDQLRKLAERTSLGLVTGSRRPLRELCRTGESRASPFWNIFHYEPVRVHALDDTDWPEFLQPLRDTGCSFEETARKEIINWTGGVPILVCALLGILWTEHQGARVSKQMVDQAAEKLLLDPSEILGPLWEDCDHEVRSDLDALSKDGIPLTRSVGRRRSVVDRGFGRVSRDRIRGSCRLMQRYAGEQAPAMTDLNRVFGSRDKFDRHIRSLLELRLKQVTKAGVDEELCRFVGNAVQHITPRPQDALTWVRSIAERALDVVWRAELPPDRTLPAEWRREGDDKYVQYPHDQGKLPRSRGQQCNILRLATGTERTTPCTKHITKTTFLLLDHLQSVGNFGQHRADSPETEVTVGFAAAVVLSAISLVECLTRDLADAMPQPGATADVLPG